MSGLLYTNNVSPRIAKEYEGAKAVQEAKLTSLATGKKYTEISEAVATRYQAMILHVYEQRAITAISNNKQALDFITSAESVMQQGIEVLENQYDTATSALGGTVSDEMRKSLDIIFQNDITGMENIANAKYGNIPMLDGSNQEVSSVSTLKGVIADVTITSLDEYISYNTISENNIIEQGTNFVVTADIGKTHSTSSNITIAADHQIIIDGESIKTITADDITSIDTLQDALKSVNADSKIQNKNIKFVAIDATTIKATAIQAGTIGNTTGAFEINDTTDTTSYDLTGGTNYRTEGAKISYDDIYGDIDSFLAITQVDDNGRYTTFTANVGKDTFVSNKIYLTEDTNHSSFDGKGNFIKGDLDITLKNTSGSSNSVGISFKTKSEGIYLSGKSNEEISNSMQQLATETNETIKVDELKIGIKGNTTLVNDYGLDEISKFDTLGSKNKYSDGEYELSMSDFTFIKDINANLASGLIALDSTSTVSTTDFSNISINNVAITLDDLEITADVTGSEYMEKLLNFLNEQTNSLSKFSYESKVYSAGGIDYSGIVIISSVIGEEGDAPISYTTTGTESFQLNGEALTAGETANLTDGMGVFTTESGIDAANVTDTVVASGDIKSSLSSLSSGAIDVNALLGGSFAADDVITITYGEETHTVTLADSGTEGITDDGNGAWTYDTAATSDEDKQALLLNKIITAIKGADATKLAGVTSTAESTAGLIGIFNTDTDLNISVTGGVSGTVTDLKQSTTTAPTSDVYQTKQDLSFTTQFAATTGAENITFTIKDTEGKALSTLKVMLAAPGTAGYDNSEIPTYTFADTGIFDSGDTGTTTDADAALKTVFETITTEETAFFADNGFTYAGGTFTNTGSAYSIEISSDLASFTDPIKVPQVVTTEEVADAAENPSNFVPTKSKENIVNTSTYNESILGSITSIEINSLETNNTKLDINLNFENRGSDKDIQPFYTFHNELQTKSTGTKFGGIISKGTEIKLVSEDNTIAMVTSLQNDFDLSADTESMYEQSVLKFQIAMNEVFKDITFSQNRSIYSLEDEHLNGTVLSGLHKEYVTLQTDDFSEKNTTMTAFSVIFGENNKPIISTNIGGKSFTLDLSKDTTGVFDSTTNTIIVDNDQKLILENSTTREKLSIGLNGVKSNILVDNEENIKKLEYALNELLGTNGKGGVSFLTGLDPKVDIISINLPSMLPADIYLDENGQDVSTIINVKTQDDAMYAIQIIDDAISRLQSMVSDLRARSSRFTQQEKILEELKTNLSNSYSLLEDISMSDAMIEMTKATLSANAAEEALGELVTIQTSSIARLLQVMSRVTS